MLNVHLTEASADALARVEEMRRWHVGPTMVRGAAKLPDDLPKARSAPTKRTRTDKKVENEEAGL